jgi:CO dehydrogenase/acetyl-CoA synthase beta subunit
MFVCLHIDMILMEAAALPSLHRSSITHTHAWLDAGAGADADAAGPAWEAEKGTRKRCWSASFMAFAILHCIASSNKSGSIDGWSS